MGLLFWSNAEKQKEELRRKRKGRGMDFGSLLFFNIKAEKKGIEHFFIEELLL